MGIRFPSLTRAAVRAEPAEAPPGVPAAPEAPEAPAATPPEIEPVPPPAGSPSAADEAPGEATRRTFQSYLAASLASFTGLVVGLPVVGYLAAPLTQTIRAAWISLGRADTFRAEEPRIVAVSVDRVDGWRRSSEARTVWVRALGAGRFKAFNGQCTHLGCAFSWKTQGEHAGKFFCPCHDGVYDAEGKVLAGPPPRELDTLETRVENGELLVLYQDFQQGISEKKPL